MKNMSIKDATKDQIEATEKLVNRVFAVLQAIYPANGYAWSNQSVMDEAKNQWLMAFIENDLTDSAVIKTGLKKCRASGSAFIPAVGQFISYCTPSPEDLGLPTHQDAYNEALKHSHPSSTNAKWSHPAIYHALVKTSRRALFEATGPIQIREMKKLFCSNYDFILQKFIDNEPFDEIPVLVTHQFPDNVPATSTGKNAISNLLKNLNKG
ncbi:MAG: replication protein P [Colwellia sp.]|nr:replication protein P [Colwellia sp.]